MLALLFSLLLCFHWVAGDNVARLIGHHDSATTPHVLSQLLVRPQFMLRDNGDGCANGWHVCPNFPNSCAPDGSFCCDSLYNCPDNTNCFEFECCPQDAQTCGGQTCCNSGSTCCSGNQDCCDSGSFCCNDSLGGCCPNGSSCISGSFACSSGGGGDGGGSSPSPPPSPIVSPVAQTSSSPTVPPAAHTSSSPIVETTPLTVTGGISIPATFSTANSSSSTTHSSSPTLGVSNPSGSSHSIIMTSVAKTVGLATVVGIIASCGFIL